MAESDLIHIGRFVEEWSAVLEPTDSAENSMSINIPDDIEEELKIVCGEEMLSCPEEPSEIMTLLKEIPPGLELVTTRLHQNELDKRKDPAYWGHLKTKMKYRLQKEPWVAVQTGCSMHKSISTSLFELGVGLVNPDGFLDQIHLSSQTSEPVTPITHKDVIINIRIYRPYIKTKTTPYPLLSQEFQVLGCQLLTDLRDLIECPADDVVAGDFSRCPDLPMDVKAKDNYKSGTFFIEDVFYNDMRYPDSRDYSKKIIKWAREPSRGVGPYTSTTMETTFNDLHVRLGHPYLYLHQGDCEHLLIFSDIRLLHPEDCKDLKRYPLLIGERMERQNRCRVCLAFTARWVTHESPLTPEDPCFFCDSCFRALHYGPGGENLATFTAHPYGKERGPVRTQQPFQNVTTL